MREWFKSFFTMIKLETKRVLRNKVVLIMLLLMTGIILALVSTASVDFANIPIAICRNGVNEGDIIDITNEFMYSENLIEVNTLEEGIDKIKNKSVSLFVYIEISGKVDTAEIYYDASDLAVIKLIENLQSKKDNFTYEKVKEMFDEYGITLNKDYFERLNFKNVNAITPGPLQISFGYEVAACIAIIIMFGISYSLARDNETNISKMISYMPVGVHKYMLSKIVPYCLLGIFQTLICLVLGHLLFGIEFQVNIMLILLLSFAFIFACSALGFLFSMIKSQISAIFCETVSVIFPLFAMLTTVISGYPLIVQIILYCLPITPYSIMLNSMMFNNVILFNNFLFLLAQSILYYLVSYMIVRK